MSIQKCLLDNSSRMIKAMSTAKSNSNEVKTGVQSGLKRVVGLAMLSLSMPVEDKNKEVFQESYTKNESSGSEDSDSQATPKVRVVPAKRKVVQVVKKFADESFMEQPEKTEEHAKNYCEIYGALLAQKLLTLQEEDRLILMNQIDNLVFETTLHARKKKRSDSD